MVVKWGKVFPKTFPCTDIYRTPTEGVVECKDAGRRVGQNETGGVGPVATNLPEDKGNFREGKYRRREGRDLRRRRGSRGPDRKRHGPCPTPPGVVPVSGRRDLDWKGPPVTVLLTGSLRPSVHPSDETPPGTLRDTWTLTVSDWTLDPSHTPRPSPGTTVPHDETPLTYSSHLSDTGRGPTTRDDPHADTV